MLGRKVPNLVFESIADQAPSSNDTSLLSPCSSPPIDPISTSEDSETPAKKKNKGNLNDTLLEKFQNLIDVENRHIELQERTDARFLILMEESNVALSRIASSMERGFPYTRLTGYDDSSDE
ncbi:uncharacterized protein LOC119675166 [Teleopsis dalmanni]|uniref:uncharacterized protein LOC119675166 n=1 Tax=Teleopsis dalmanni TaxID=139649 RepID=UPI0018CF778E|nr:uncharacterized protein LOC119675166 [Teleopsis dalmanni]